MGGVDPNLSCLFSTLPLLVYFMGLPRTRAPHPQAQSNNTRADLCLFTA